MELVVCSLTIFVLDIESCSYHSPSDTDQTRARFLPFLVSVSYTHLDVYKRQSQSNRVGIEIWTGWKICICCEKSLRKSKDYLHCGVMTTNRQSGEGRHCINPGFSNCCYADHVLVSKFQLSAGCWKLEARLKMAYTVHHMQRAHCKAVSRGCVMIYILSLILI